MRTKPLGAVGLGLLILCLSIAIAAPAIAPQDPWQVHPSKILSPPGASSWFGTDQVGRDILSRTMYGARMSIFIGIMSMVSAAALGAAIGVTSAYFGGWLDLTMQRFIDALTAFPPLLLALALMAAFGASLNSVIIALIITFTPRTVRITRSVALSIKETPFVDAARAIGAGHRRIVFLHVLPNTFAPLMVITTSLMGSAIIIEASLSFLGVGIPTSVISWGGMLSGQVLQNFASAPWIGIFPGFALTTLVFGINVFGDALRDALDPKMRGR